MAQRNKHTNERSYGRRFYLVQRVYPSPRERMEKSFGGAFKSNPFGYGRLGDYELDYMGSAEFEFGALGESLRRLSAAQDKEDIIQGRMTYNDQNLIFLYIGEDGDPSKEFIEWVEIGKCHGKEPAHGFYERLTDPKAYAAYLEKRGKYGRLETQVWWSLLDDVMWSFVDEDGTSHLEKMVASMSAESNQVRGN